LLAYQADGSFSQPVDSSVFSAPFSKYTGGGYAWQTGDTINYPGITTGRDYIITLLPIGKTWKLSEIKYQTDAYATAPASQSTPELPCPIASYLVDGKRIEYPSTEEPASANIYLQ
jgi:hypothetical protein